jgi:prevent-host-death family protein
MAITAGVRELKNRLTHYLRLVEQGERVIVTDRHRPIAILQSIEQEFEQETIEERLASLSRSGGLTLAEPGHRRKRWRAAKSEGTPPSRIIRDDRDSR